MDGRELLTNTLGKKKRKPGRPRLPKGEAKGKIVPIRLTKAEADLLAEAAKRDDEILSEWLRCAVLAASKDGVTRRLVANEGSQR